MSVARYFRLVGASGKIRTEKFAGVDHIVIPIIALKEGVIQPMNAPAPEFVAASVLSKVPGGWNGRPVMTDHPLREGLPVSANHPEVLETESIGLVFNTKAENDELQMEAWVNIPRALQTERGKSVVDRASAGQPLEVSVGAFVRVIEAQGEFRGAKYSVAWDDLIPDHLAILSEGVLGACSNAMGCGIRAASAKNVLTKDGVEIQMAKTLTERFAALFTKMSVNAKEDLSDGDVRSRLWDALFSMEPAFSGILDVFSDPGLVVYEVFPEGKFTIYRRSFSVADDGSVTLAGDREEVKPVMRYEAASAAAATAGCGCKSNPKSGEITVNKTERIAALAAKLKINSSALETLSDEQLTALETATPVEAASTAAPAPAPPATPAPSVSASQPASSAAQSAPSLAAASQPVTFQQVLASADANTRAMIQRGLATLQREKDGLIAKIKACATNKFTDAQLSAKDVDELEAIAALAAGQVTDTEVSFAGQGQPRPTVAAAGDQIEKPQSTEEALKALRGGK
jgi:hypothetical protein